MYLTTPPFHQITLPSGVARGALVPRAWRARGALVARSWRAGGRLTDRQRWVLQGGYPGGGYPEGDYLG